ncbi:LysM peptidoglycan-binding domain-containing protein [Metabacillus sp. Hm71]|uniref:C40 family peptidase n=1 Tax=Metabacillus sp. Hm71 TaxID=3450743 RepID=UPI003F41EC66
MKQKLIGLTATAVVSSTLFTSMAAAESIKVKSGDTLWELSRDYNTSVKTLMDLNGLNSSFLRVGQVLEVPGPKKTSSASSSSTSGTTQKKPITSTSTYKVKAGDSLWVISRRYNTSVSELKRLNGLKGDLIYVGQTLVVKKTAGQTAGNSQSSNQAEKPTNSGSSSSTYTVKAGDSLWKIANKFNITIAELKVTNNLKSDFLMIGQVLKVNGEVSKPSTNKSGSQGSQQSSSVSKVDKMISEAKALMGTPYRWGGNTPSGFDCSGFIYYVLNKVTSVSRLSTAGYWDMMKSVSTPSVGDFVYFTTYKAGPSHMGIYLGNNEFIHASSSGVTISNLNNTYWKQRYLGAKRF